MSPQPEKEEMTQMSFNFMKGRNMNPEFNFSVGDYVALGIVLVISIGCIGWFVCGLCRALFR